MVKGRPAFAIAAAVMEEAASLFRVSVWDIVRAGNTRENKIVRVRWAVIWVLRQLEWPDGRRAYSAPRIAKVLRYADHTTVLHGYREAEFWRERDPEFRQLTDELLGHAAMLWAEP